MVTRFGVIERGLKVFFMTIDDQARLVNAVVKARKRKRNLISVPEEAIPEPEAHEPAYPWKSWGKGDIFSVAFALTCLSLILAAPFILGVPAGAIADSILGQLTP